jgi:hypothetical protein
VLSVLHRYLTAGALALALAGSIAAQNAAPKDSPFLPSPFVLTGVRLGGDDTRVCIYAEKDQRSRWITVGGIADGIQVVSYDPAQQRAVIAVGGATRDLWLQHGGVSAQNPVAIPGSSSAPTAAANASVGTPSAPGVESSAQRDDRMLVSDLLEIGMEQRQAYANAQKGTVAPAAGTK